VVLGLEQEKKRNLYFTMILDRQEHSHRYHGLHSLFPRAFEFLEQSALAQMPLEKRELAGNDLYIMISKDRGKKEVDAPLEAHRKYIDIHYCIDGEERIGWRGTSTCKHPGKPYDPETDFMTFTDPVESWVVLTPGWFAIFFPTDAHAPMVSKGVVHKAVVKVSV